MLRMLDRFGSERLRADVAMYGPLVLQLPGTSLDDFELVFDHLRALRGSGPCP